MQLVVYDGVLKELTSEQLRAAPMFDVEAYIAQTVAKIVSIDEQIRFEKNIRLMYAYADKVFVAQFFSDLVQMDVAPYVGSIHLKLHETYVIDSIFRKLLTCKSSNVGRGEWLIVLLVKGAIWSSPQNKDAIDGKDYDMIVDSADEMPSWHIKESISGKFRFTDALVPGVTKHVKKTDDLKSYCAADDVRRQLTLIQRLIESSTFGQEKTVILDRKSMTLTARRAKDCIPYTIVKNASDNIEIHLSLSHIKSKKKKATTV